MRRTRALIVGGGPAGAAAAIALARGGAAPLLLERTVGPHDVVCGGFLGWDALAALARLGVDAGALGAHPIRRVRLVTARRTIEARLPHAAAGLSRRTLDEALLRQASAAGAVVERGVAVRAADSATLSVRLDSGKSVAGDALLLATGKHELRGLARPRAVLDRDPVVGLRTALQPSPALRREMDGVIELHLFDGGYAGLLVQDDGAVNLCLSVARERLNDAGGIESLLARLGRDAPRLGERLAGGEAGAWEAIAGVPYGWRARATDPGLFRLGDQAAVIASLAGDGVAIALTSGMAAAAALLREGPAGAQAFQACFARDSARPLAVAGGLRRAAEDPRRRAAMMGLLRLMPALAPLAARLTRIG